MKKRINVPLIGLLLLSAYTPYLTAQEETLTTPQTKATITATPTKTGTATLYTSSLKNVRYEQPALDPKKSFTVCNIKQKVGRSSVPVTDRSALKKYKGMLKHAADGNGTHVITVHKNSPDLAFDVCDDKGTAVASYKTEYSPHTTIYKTVQASPTKDRKVLLKLIDTYTHEYIVTAPTDAVLSPQPFIKEDYAKARHYLIIPANFKNKTTKETKLSAFIKDKQTGEIQQPAALEVMVKNTPKHDGITED